MEWARNCGSSNKAAKTCNLSQLSVFYFASKPRPLAVLVFCSPLQLLPSFLLSLSQLSTMYLMIPVVMGETSSTNTVDAIETFLPSSVISFLVVLAQLQSWVQQCSRAANSLTVLFHSQHTQQRSPLRGSPLITLINTPVTAAPLQQASIYIYHHPISPSCLHLSPVLLFRPVLPLHLLTVTWRNSRSRMQHHHLHRATTHNTTWNKVKNSSKI